MTTSEALAFLKTNGYVVIPNALTADEVAFLNEWVDRDMAAHPADWHGGKTQPRGHAHPPGTRRRRVVRTRSSNRSSSTPPLSR